MTNKICNDRTGGDKWLHFFFSLLIGGVLAGLLSMVRFLGPAGAGAVTFGAVMGVGLYKELRDRRRQGNHFCFWDLLYDAAGAVLTAGMAYAANYQTWHV